MLNWKWTENRNFYYSPAAVTPVSDGKNVYVSTPDKFVSSIDLLLGKTNWRKNDFNSWESIGISSDKQRIFVKSITDKLNIVSAKDGRRIREIDAKFGLDTMPVEIIEVNGMIYFGTKNGMVFSIDEKYQLKPLLYLGTARVHSIKYLGDNTLSVSNMDGKIVVFKL
jgi:outer membrane protein assembly factor BamB